jgi:hypothetical protein
MRSLNTIVALGIILVTSQSILAADGSSSDAISELQAKVKQLETQLAAVQANSNDEWLTEQRADEIRGLVHEVLADADTRASLLQSGMTAGYDNGFFIGSDDGNFKLKINGQLQFRYIYNVQDNSPEDDYRSGFENTRTKLKFSGNVVSPNWVYMIEGNFARSGGAFTLEDAYIGYAIPDTGWTLIAGQFKVPMLREEAVDSSRQLAVERSLVNEEFTAGRTQGFAVDYRGDWLHWIAGYTDGHPATGGFNAPALDRDTEYSFTARVEALAAGEWSQFTDLTSWNGESYGCMVGGALHYQDGEYGTADDETEVLQWTVDMSVEFGGANLLAYVVGRHINSTALDVDQFGIVVQGGYFVTDDWEVFGRYEWGDDDLTGDDLSALTIGATRYFSQHQLKWTTDIGFGINEVTSTWGDGLLGTGGDIAGWRTDGPGEDAQFVLRSQLQLLF